MKILTLCGSIRKESSNHALLKAAQAVFPVAAEWGGFDLQLLPYFDPQLQFGEGIPAIVKELRQKAQQADFIIIATPEYAHGIPGILKNALEWLVCEETLQKRVIVFIGAPSGGEFVKEYLLETLRTMDLVASSEATLVVRAARKQISEVGEISDPKLHATLKSFLNKYLAQA